jgi:hypothetical protein
MTDQVSWQVNFICGKCGKVETGTAGWTGSNQVNAISKPVNWIAKTYFPNDRVGASKLIVRCPECFTKFGTGIEEVK